MKAPKQVTAYRCPVCKWFCHSMGDASEHCMEFIDRAYAWDCGGSCDMEGLHNTKAEAQACSPKATDCTDCGHPERWHYITLTGTGGLCFEGACLCREYVAAVAV